MDLQSLRCSKLEPLCDTKNWHIWRIWPKVTPQFILKSAKVTQIHSNCQAAIPPKFAKIHQISAKTYQNLPNFASQKAPALNTQNRLSHLRMPRIQKTKETWSLDVFVNPCCSCLRRSHIWTLVWQKCSKLRRLPKPHDQQAVPASYEEVLVIVSLQFVLDAVETLDLMYPPLDKCTDKKFGKFWGGGVPSIT